jgi:hypothetical protein
MEKRRLGRPPKPKGTTLPETLQIRLTGDDKSRFFAAAERAGMTFSEWMRDRLTKAAIRESKQD